MRSAVVMATDPVIDADNLPISVTRPGPRLGGNDVPTTNLKELERLALEQALEQADGNRAQAAKLLGISRSSVFVKIREYGLS